MLMNVRGNAVELEFSVRHEPETKKPPPASEAPHPDQKQIKGKEKLRLLFLTFSE